MHMRFRALAPHDPTKSPVLLDGFVTTPDPTAGRAHGECIARYHRGKDEQHARSLAVLSVRFVPNRVKFRPVAIDRRRSTHAKSCPNAYPMWNSRNLRRIR